ncbi:MAG TPA: DUF6134 family protein [Kiloniellaceae bacterium]
MQRRHALTLLGATAGGLALTAALPAAACGLFPQASGLFSQASGWRFLVLRHGEPIGTQRMTFSRRGDDSVVEVAIDIAVDVLGITVFRFTHRAEEVWRGGQLWSLVSDTDDDGTRWRVQAERRNGMLRGSVNGAGFEAPGSILPASLWHPDTTKAQALLDTIDGRVKTVDCRDLGEEAVPVAGAETAARHFRLTGEIERDVWYDANCAIARVTLRGRDGSRIALARQ